MQASHVTNTLYSQLYFRDQRQKVIANNVANVNTPGYKTKDSMFEKAIQDTMKVTPLSMSITNKMHIPSDITSTIKKNYDIQTFKVKNLPEQNDGNNVDLDKQLSKSSQNTMLFNAIAGAVKKDTLWFKTVLDASSKN